jgi:NADH-quinone oxidoreductase subunit C
VAGLSDAPTTAETELQALPGDGLREGIVDELRRRLGEALLDSHLRPNDDLWVRVATDAWRPAGEALLDMGFEYFCFLSALDWLPSPYGRGEDDPTEPPPERSTEVVQGYAGGESRFQVFARVTDTRRHVGVTIKADVPDDSSGRPTRCSASASPAIPTCATSTSRGSSRVTRCARISLFCPGW